ncbi:RDD family protein [Glycomyces tenuis]|uniref:RDD family protein n=1 Tax=Glycomyces tenuis TaxID=58116 RepID=UPI000405B52B|nr:RDD family protein [Glycomyces tenuis]
MTTERGGAEAGADEAGQDLAGLGERFTALFIDWVACLVLTYLLEWIGLGIPGPAGVNVATPVLFIVYYSFAMTVGSQSLGMAIMRIACVSAATGGRLGLPRAVLRAVLLSLVLPALTTLADPYHRGLHDRAAGSVMLKVAGA